MTADATQHPADEEADATARPQWRDRFVAWWEGLPPPGPRPAAPPREAPAPETPSPPPPADSGNEKASWPDRRLDLLQTIDPDGHLLPGAEADILDLSRPLGLDETMSLVELHSGCGAGLRLLAKTYGVYGTGLEPLPPLARRAMEAARKAGLAKKAPVRPYSPLTDSLKPASFHVALCRERLTGLGNKETVLSVLANALKLRGQLLLVDFVLADERPARPRLANWQALEAPRPQPWSAAAYEAFLDELGMDVRISEDVTAAYRARVGALWDTIMQRLAALTLSRDELMLLMREATLWSARTAALDAGEISVRRILAIK